MLSAFFCLIFYKNTISLTISFIYLCNNFQLTNTLAPKIVPKSSHQKHPYFTAQNTDDLMGNQPVAFTGNSGFLSKNRLMTTQTA